MDGQTVAQTAEPYAALRTFACSSLSFLIYYTFVFHFLLLLQNVDIL